jgi:uncharacterized protein (TIGR03083 family)
MTQDRAGIWAVVRTERARLVDDLRTVAPSGWTTPSLCAGWDVHDVLAHLVDSAQTTRLAFIGRMIGARFDFDADNARGVAEQKRADPRLTLEAMRAVIGLRRTPPAPLATRLVEAFVHGEDIRRPLGIAAGYPTAAVVVALQHQLRTGAGMGGAREHVAGLRLRAVDADHNRGGLHHDSGAAQVAGRAIDLLLAVSGRPIRQGAIIGDGVPVLDRRLDAVR